MEHVLERGQREAVYEVARQVGLEVRPMKPVYERDERVYCKNTNNKTFGSLLLMELTLFPISVKADLVYIGSILFDDRFPGGQYIIRCRILQPTGLYDEVHHSFIIHETPTKVDVTPVYHGDQLVALQCQPDGFPDMNFSYNWLITYHPGGVLMADGRWLYTTPFTTAGLIEGRCVVQDPALEKPPLVAGTGNAVYTGRAFNRREFEQMFVKSSKKTSLIIHSLCAVGLLWFTISLMKFCAVGVEDDESTMEALREQQETNSYIVLRGAELQPIYTTLVDLVEQFDRTGALINQTRVLCGTTVHSSGTQSSTPIRVSGRATLKLAQYHPPWFRQGQPQIGYSNPTPSHANDEELRAM
ncbi:unnamed protein product [Dicrocoelium dendriticum]|nr:unnamed protein product [Dicrocoelium dendriticum]